MTLATLETQRYCPLEVGGVDGSSGDSAEAVRQFFVAKLSVDVTVCILVLTGNALTICALLHQRWCRKETLCPRFKVSLQSHKWTTEIVH